MYTYVANSEILEAKQLMLTSQKQFGDSQQLKFTSQSWLPTDQHQGPDVNRLATWESSGA